MRAGLLRTSLRFLTWICVGLWSPARRSGRRRPLALALVFSGSAGSGVAVGCRNRCCCGGSVKTDETEDERLGQDRYGGADAKPARLRRPEVRVLVLAFAVLFAVIVSVAAQA